MAGSQILAEGNNRIIQPQGRTIKTDSKIEGMGIIAQLNTGSQSQLFPYQKFSTSMKMQVFTIDFYQICSQKCRK